MDKDKFDKILKASMFKPRKDFPNYENINAENSQIEIIKAFEYDNQKIRTIYKDNEIWFVGIDICKILGISKDVHKILNRVHIDDRNTIPVIDNLKRKQDTTIINESGLYTLILKSRKPEAEKFQRWVTKEVLPSIRKTGKYQIKGIGSQATENDNRLPLRKQIKEHNKGLVSEAKKAGVKTNLEYAIFQNKGYQGLYDGLGRKEIAKKKGLDEKKPILDYMGSTELAANYFRVTQTEEKLKGEPIKTKEKANEIHYVVGKKVREAMKSISGVVPEDLPFVENIKTIEKKDNKSNLIEKLKFKDFSKDLWKICALIIYEEGTNNQMSTGILVKKLPLYIEIEDQYKKLIKDRKEPKYAIMIRNIKSNKRNKVNPIYQGYLMDIKGGFSLTPKGISSLKNGFRD